MTDFFAIVDALLRHGVRFIIVGGLAGVLRGVPLQTFDLDIVHERSEENIANLLAALEELNAYARYHPQRPRPNGSYFVGIGHVLLETDHGSLDVLGSIDGGATFDDLLQHTSAVNIEGDELLILELPHLLEVKRRAGRDKDLAVLKLIEHAIAVSEEE